MWYAFKNSNSDNYDDGGGGGKINYCNINVTVNRRIGKKNNKLGKCPVVVNTKNYYFK